MTGLLLLMMGCGDKEDDASTDGGASPEDADGDGYDTSEDCDDTSDAISPEAVEVCDGIDNDCDGRIDDGLTSAWFTDSDGDGFGAFGDVLYACEEPGAGYSLEAGDCDDSDAAVFPGAEEICDGIDNDCGGVVDDSLRTTFYLDADGDGYGDDAEDTEACESPGEDHVEVGGDCDDADAKINPGAEEICDGIDNNCVDDLAGASWTDALLGLESDLTETFQAGTEEAPAELSFDEDGTLTLCEGFAYASISATANVDLVGAYGAEATTISGGGAVGVLWVEGAADLVITGLTIADGAADLGAGLYIGGGAEGIATDVVFADNTADTAGGGVFVEEGSRAEGYGVTFDGNSPDDISRGTKKAYSADKKGGYTCAADTSTCE